MAGVSTKGLAGPLKQMLISNKVSTNQSGHVYAARKDPRRWVMKRSRTVIFLTVAFVAGVLATLGGEWGWE